MDTTDPPGTLGALGTLEIDGRPFQLDRATRNPVLPIGALLRDDPVGAGRETAVDEEYLAASDRVDVDPANTLVAVHDDSAAAVATLQLTVVPGLSRAGTTRVLVEAVRVAEGHRGSGLGTALLTWVARAGVSTRRSSTLSDPQARSVTTARRSSTLGDPTQTPASPPS